MVVSDAGQIEICDKGNLVGAVCIMLDNGTVNSTQNVTVEHLEMSLIAIGSALPHLDAAIIEALAGQEIERRTQAIERRTEEAWEALQAASSSSQPPQPQSPPPLVQGSFKFGSDEGIIVAPHRSADRQKAPIILLVPPTGGFSSVLPTNCPRPCWYAYMQWTGGNWKLDMPDTFLQFVQFLRERAEGRPIIGWGLSRGAKWLIELMQHHSGLLNGAVMWAGYPRHKGMYEEQASARELIAVQNCFICMVHYAADPCCGVHCYPYWHAVLGSHMAATHNFVSLIMPGDHNAARKPWFTWTGEAAEFAFKMMWEALVDGLDLD